MPTKKTVKKVGTSEPKEKNKFNLEITVNGETTKVGTNDIQKALTAFERPALIKTDFVVSAKSGKKTVEQVLMVQAARRLFNNGTAMILFAKNLSSRLDA